MKKARSKRGTYRIVRLFLHHPTQKVRGAKGLSLAEAQAYCRNPEGSSKTCRRAENVRRTERMGPWFEGFEEE